jgi:L-ascorbate metabolism protein UlaG (beta-lactamase superfamily)
MKRAGRIAMRTGSVLLAMLALFAAFVLISGWSSFGATPADRRQARIALSPQWHDGRFGNPRPTWIDVGGALWRTAFGPSAPAQQPDGAIPFVKVDGAALARPPATGLRVTWFGHSSALVEIDGTRVLVDPTWSERASPVGWAGPRRWFAPPIGPNALPAIDAVVISHDHYDHLDRATIVALKGTKAIFVVPLGIGAHLEYWGIPASRIVELDWWEGTKLGVVEIVATPARHASGRMSTSSNRTLWAGYAMVGPKHRVWYSGDTGFQPEFARIGERLGPFDVTLIDTGQYDPAWPDNHLGPEMAVEVHRLVRGKLMLPVHWSLFGLAPHGWTEPVERVLAAARCADIKIILPRPGESVEPTMARLPTRWWPNLPWRSAAQTPVLSTVDGSPSRRFSVRSCATMG